MYELKKIGKVFTSKFVGTGPSSYKKRIYRAAVSQRLRNTGIDYRVFSLKNFNNHESTLQNLQKVKQWLSSPYNRPRKPRGRVEVYLYSFFNLGTSWGGGVVNTTPHISNLNCMLLLFL